MAWKRFDVLNNWKLILFHIQVNRMLRSTTPVYPVFIEQIQIETFGVSYGEPTRLTGIAKTTFLALCLLLKNLKTSVINIITPLYNFFIKKYRTGHTDLRIRTFHPVSISAFFIRNNGEITECILLCMFLCKDGKKLQRD